MWNLKQTNKLMETESRLVVAEGRGETGEGGRMVQTSSYKMSKFWGCNVRQSDYS